MCTAGSVTRPVPIFIRGDQQGASGACARDTCWSVGLGRRIHAWATRGGPADATCAVPESLRDG